MMTSKKEITPMTNLVNINNCNNITINVHGNSDVETQKSEKEEPLAIFSEGKSFESSAIELISYDKYKSEIGVVFKSTSNLIYLYEPVSLEELVSIITGQGTDKSVCKKYHEILRNDATKTHRKEARADYIV